jgi:hypothetical protein
VFLERELEGAGVFLCRLARLWLSCTGSRSGLAFYLAAPELLDEGGVSVSVVADPLGKGFPSVGFSE